MRQLSHDTWLAIGLFGLLILVTIAAATQQTQEQVLPALSSFSSTPNGARALWLALAELDYQVSNGAPAFSPSSETGLILMLEPFPGVTPEEWRILDNWVEAGGTLVLAGDSLGMAFAANHYSFDLNYLESNSPATLTSQTPLLLSPPTGPAPLQTLAYFETSRSDFVTHLAVEAGPVLVSFNQGAGRLILCTAPFLFSNAGLKASGNPALVLNIISAAKRSGVIWFDEWHHGLRSTQEGIAGPGDWLRYTPAGHALLYAGLIIFAALLLRGQLFGRPVPLPKDTARRAPLEYITAIANLNRRAGHRQAVLRQYQHQLKRSLGQRYRLDPTLADDLYLKQLAQLNPTLDIAALHSLLARLAQRQMSETEMIQLAAEISPWLKEST